MSIRLFAAWNSVQLRYICASDCGIVKNRGSWKKHIPEPLREANSQEMEASVFFLLPIYGVSYPDFQSYTGYAYSILGEI